MESFRLTSESGKSFEISVTEAGGATPDLVKALIDIDLQTFAESTYSHYTAAVFMEAGAVFLLKADDAIIGSCVCVRCWDHPSEAKLVSMGIRPGWRGRGLGQRFLNQVMGRLESRGLKAMRLLVGADNKRAVQVYKDVGFTVERVVVSDPRTREALLLLRYQLQDATPVVSMPSGSSS